MDRRNSIKALLVGSAATGVFIGSCKTGSDKVLPKEAAIDEADRMEEEKLHNKKLDADVFFTPAEMATIAVLADIIIPKDAVSGSATDAKVPDFIEFIVKDMPDHQTPLRGGLRWLELESLKRFEKDFVVLTAEQRTAIVEDIAYPKKVKPAMQQGAAFFSLMRNLTATGFYTSEMGVKDIGYMGNVPNQWNGVPDEVLKQYKLSYTAKELSECVRFDKI